MLIGISGKIKSGKDTMAMMIQALTMNNLFGGTRWKNDPLAYVQAYKDRPNLKGGFEIRRHAGPIRKIVSILTGCSEDDLQNEDFKDNQVPAEWNRTAKEAREWLVMKDFVKGTNTPISTKDDREIEKMAAERGFIFTRTYREMMQEIGTDLFRNRFHPSTWINAAYSTYKKVSPLGGFVNTPGAIHEEKYPNWIFADVRFPDEVEAIKKRDGIIIRINRTVENRFPGGMTARQKVASTHSSETSLDNYNGFDRVVDNNGTLEELLAQTTEIVNNLNLK